MRRKVLRRHALWIAALILVVLISSTTLVLLGTRHHHCPGQGCRLCEAVEQGARQLGIFSLVLLAAFFARLNFFRGRRMLACDKRADKVLSPVRMRVRMND